jgi:hypothetical protein
MSPSVTIVSMLRLQSLLNFAATTNITWSFYELSRWSTLEICLGIVCTCLPTVRLLLVRIFPALHGSSRRRNSPYSLHEIGAGHPAMAHATGAVVAAKGPSSSDLEAIALPGVVYLKTHDNQHSDSDQARLVVHG